MGGDLFEPAVIADVNLEMRLANEAIFGPIALFFRFEVEEEAVVMGNDTEYGLAACFFTQDSARVFRVSEAFVCSMIA
ncbi:MAG: aldehyde dehydrogenase family protein [Amphritea sp.]